MEQELFILVATPELHDPFGFFDRTVLLVQKMADGTHRGSAINKGRVWKEGNAICLNYAGPMSSRDVKSIILVNDGKLYYDWQDEESTSPENKTLTPDDFVLICLGWAGWGAGQVEEEILRGSWFRVDLDRDIIADQDLDTLWERLVRQEGGNPDEYEEVETAPFIIIDVLKN